MTIPTTTTLLLPILSLAADGQEHTLKETIAKLADELQLSDEDRSQLQPSGRQTKFEKNVAWARLYLDRAGLIQSTGRGKYRITPLGEEIVKSKPQNFGVGSLRKFPNFKY